MKDILAKSKKDILAKLKKKAFDRDLGRKLKATRSKDYVDNEISLKKHLTYMFANEYNIKFKALIVLDTLLFGIYFIWIGFGFSWILNNYTVKPLDRSQKKAKVAGEVLAECLMIVFFLYVAIQIVLRLPSLIKNPPAFHKNYRIYGGGIILTYALVALQHRLTTKVRYVFNAKKDRDYKILDDIIVAAREDQAWPFGP